MRYFLFVVAIVCSASLGWAHGIAHRAGGASEADVTASSLVNADGAEFFEPSPTEKTWHFDAVTGWEGRHVHFGVNETGSSGIYFNEANVEVSNFEIGIWNGFGVGNQFNEWDFSAAYHFENPGFFILPGYNFRYAPGHVDEGHEHGEEHEHAGNHEHGKHEEHEHGLYGNEIFLATGTTFIPYVIPGLLGIVDMNHLPGSLVEMRLDGDVPLWEKRITLQPYSLLSYNLGYNLDTSGWNNFQTGMQCSCQLTRWLSIFAGANWSVPLTALDSGGQNETFWINLGLRVSY